MIYIGVPPILGTPHLQILHSKSTVFFLRNAATVSRNTTASGLRELIVASSWWF